MITSISDQLFKSAQTKKDLAHNRQSLEKIAEAIHAIVACFRRNGKVLLCGNGGSAADAQHIAAELTGRFKLERKPLHAEALSVNSSYITAVANDYGYEEVFARMVEAKGHKGDVLIAISTSGNSPNVIKAAERAKELNMTVITMTGERSNELGKHADIKLKVPSAETPRIQEAHITIGHILCQEVEKELFA